MNNEYPNIGAAIREGRRKKKWKQKELAKILDVSSSLVSLWETNTRIPLGDDLIKIANLLDIVDILFPRYSVELKDKDGDEFSASFLLRDGQSQYAITNMRKEIEELRSRVEKLEQSKDY